jgi:hypothetical protein
LRLHRIWAAMIWRCTNEDDARQKRYGNRGISVAPEWENYLVFKGWAIGSGYDDNLQIDRIDNDGDYEPGNCRWVTCAQNARNKSSNRMLTAFGETKCIADWLLDERCVLRAADGITKRIERGYTVEDAISIPDTRGRRRARDARGKFL